MRRRHLLALVILALVVATVLAFGPVRVWDALTLRTVEEHWPNGQLKRRYQRQWWSGESVYSHVGSWEEWHEDGQPAHQIIANSLGNGYAKAWSRNGHLIAYHSTRRGEAHTGVYVLEQPVGMPPTSWVIEKQWRRLAGVDVETRTSPPWFTEEEILQSVEGVEE